MVLGVRNPKPVTPPQSAAAQLQPLYVLYVMMGL